MAIDPAELANQQIQRSAAAAGGSPTSFAKGPAQDGVQVAAGGRFGELANVLRGVLLGPAETILPGGERGMSGSVSAATDNQLPGTIPTPQESGVVADPSNYSMRATQKALAPQVLTPEGVQRFEQRGFQAPKSGEAGAPGVAVPEQANVLTGAADALDAQAIDAANQAVDIKKTANLALTADQMAWKPETAIVPEKQSDEVLARIAAQDAEIKSIQDGGDFNFEYINTPDDVKAVITAMGETYKDAQVAVTRGVVPNGVTMERAAAIAADEIGLTRKLLRRKVGDGSLNAEEMVASRELLVRSATRLEALARSIKTGTATAIDKLAFRRQMAIHAGIQLQVKGAQTEAARTLQSFQIPVSGEMTLDRVSQEAQRLLSENNVGDSTEALANQFLQVAQANGLKGINEFARRGWGVRVKDGLSEAYLAGLLSSPATQMKNILGTASFMAYQVPAEMLSGLYGAAIRKTYGVLRPGSMTEDQVYMQDAFIRMKGWADSFRDALKASSVAFNLEVPSSQTSRLDVDTYTGIASGVDNMFGKSIDVFGKAVRIPFRLLLSGDEFFKTISQRGELYVAANRRYQASRNAGKTVDESLDEAGMVLLDPGSISNELDITARYQTMTSDLGTFGKITGSVQQYSLLGIPVGRILLPFATAPTNSMLRTAEFAGFNPSAWADLAGRNGIKAHQLAAGRMGVGAATMWTVGQYALEGKVTGAMPEDKKLRDALPKGWQPYSFVFRGDGFPNDENGEPLPLYDVYGRPNGPLTYFSYGGFEPVGAIIGITADVVQRTNKTRDPEMRNNLAAAALLATLDYYKQLPMLQGIADVVYAIDYGNPMQLMRGPAEAASPLGVPNPLSSLQRGIQRGIDPTRVKPAGKAGYYTEADVLSTNPDGTFKFSKSDGTPDYRMVGLQKGDFSSSMQKIFAELDAYQSKDSFIRDERDKNAITYDTLGNAMGAEDVSFANNPMLAVFNNFSGFKISAGKDPTPMELELIRLSSMTSNWPLTTPESKSGIRLTNGMISDWARISKNTMLLKQPGLGPVSFREALEALVSDPTTKQNKNYYTRLDDKGKVTLIKNLEQDYLDAGFEELLMMPEYSNLAQAYADAQRLREEGAR